MAMAHGAAPATVETRAYRKVTRPLLPFLMLCYVAAYLDRVNIRFAKPDMLGDLGFSETRTFGAFVALSVPPETRQSMIVDT